MARSPWLSSACQMNLVWAVDTQGTVVESHTPGHCGSWRRGPPLQPVLSPVVVEDADAEERGFRTQVQLHPAGVGHPGHQHRLLATSQDQCKRACVSPGHVPGGGALAFSKAKAQNSLFFFFYFGHWAVQGLNYSLPKSKASLSGGLLRESMISLRGSPLHFLSHAFSIFPTAPDH